MPVEELGVDGAVLFADIMLPLEPMGVSLEIQPDLGPVIDSPIRDMAAVQRLRPLEAEAGVPFVLETIRGLRNELADGRAAIIGFCGAPFTLACYLIEGRPVARLRTCQGADDARAAVWSALMDRLTDGMLNYLKAQVAAGADVIQVFDSWIGSLSPDDYERSVLPWMRRLFAELRRPARRRSTSAPVTRRCWSSWLPRAATHERGLAGAPRRGVAAHRLGPRHPGQPGPRAARGRPRARPGRQPRPPRPRRRTTRPHLQPWPRRDARDRPRRAQAARRGSSRRDHLRLMPITGVVLMTYGSPRDLDDVGAYITRVRGGRAPDEALLAEFRRRYAVIGMSPLIEITHRQASGLEAVLGEDFRVAAGMRFSEPSVDAAVEDVVSRGAQQLVGLILSPQYAATLMGGYDRALESAAGGIPCRTVHAWHLNPAFVDVLARRIRDADAARFAPSGPAHRTQPAPTRGRP